MNKESLKHIQNISHNASSKEQSALIPHKSEYQTVGLFAILGALTLIFVLMIRLF